MRGTENLFQFASGTRSVAAILSAYFSVAALMPSSARADVLYQVIDLGVISTNSNALSKAFGINNLGQVCGEVTVDKPGGGTVTQAFLWLREAAFSTPSSLAQGFHVLGSLAGTSATSIAEDVNDLGVVCGLSAHSNAGVGRGFVWLAEPVTGVDIDEREMYDIGTLLDDPAGNSHAYALQNFDDGIFVVGDSDYDDPEESGHCRNAFEWSGATEEMDALEVLDGNHYNTSAFGVNPGTAAEGRKIAGNATDGSCEGGGGAACSSSTQRPPARWIPDPLPLNIEPSGEDEEDGTDGIAFDANDDDNYVGWGMGSATDCDKHAALWVSGGAVPIDLHVEAGMSSLQQTEALAIRNDGEQIVGRTLTLDALLWEEGGSGWEVTVLNDVIDSGLGWDLQEAHDVNDDGWITGWGVVNLKTRAFILVPLGDCPADIDDDGDVDFQDLLILLNTWGECPVGQTCFADLDGNGEVGFGDLLIVLNNWDECGSNAEIPETLEDCLERFDPGTQAFERCVELIEQ